jgi:hypothetical protein
VRSLAFLPSAHVAAAPVEVELDAVTRDDDRFHFDVYRELFRFVLKRLAAMVVRARLAKDVGWLCENHLDKPWDAELGCVCGAGVPCKCNETGGVDELDVSQVIEDGSQRRH